MAMTMKNLLALFKKPVTAAGRGSRVVTTEASTKKRTNQGKIFFRLTVTPVPRTLFSSCLVRRKASTSVIGMMARVRVILTMAAVSSVLLPCIPSQAAAAAVTEEVSLTAVPAKSPKPSLDSPSIPPRVGKVSAARTLNRKITEMDWAISSSSAPMTGAVAAMAEPPQMEEPTPIKVDILASICSSLCKTKAATSEVVMVDRMMGRDWAPTLATLDRFMPKPSRTTASWSIFFEVKVMPARAWPCSFQNRAMTIPRRMANTGPPTTSKVLPKNQAGTAIHRQTRIPGPFLLIHSIWLSSPFSATQTLLAPSKDEACRASYSHSLFLVKYFPAMLWCKHYREFLSHTYRRSLF